MRWLSGPRRAEGNDSLFAAADFYLRTLTGYCTTEHTSRSHRSKIIIIVQYSIHHLTLRMRTYVRFSPSHRTVGAELHSSIATVYKL